MREKIFRAWIGGSWFYFRVGAAMSEAVGVMYALACEDGVEWFEFVNRKDKNNAKIFEGAICNIRRRESRKWEVGEIIYSTSDGGVFHVRCYWGKKSKSDYYGVRFSEIAEFEVIGSTLEDPELLEEAK